VTRNTENKPFLATGVTGNTESVTGNTGSVTRNTEFVTGNTESYSLYRLL